MPDDKQANALIHETSPYLLQHAYNPVNWYPWGKQALDRAREEDKPILLSIGYSACHWCHVMAHESFEDTGVAALMNELYINIKVDREERPDLDRIYQTAQQLLTRRGGGWPLTMFLAPDDQVPFFGGTYFPPDTRHGLPGFPDVLRQVAAFYHQERQTVSSYKTSLLDAFERIQEVSPLEGSVQIESDLLNVGAHELVQSFDRHHGGFGSAPKFPTPANLVRLLNQYQLMTPEPNLLEVVTLTLQRMAEGGLYDQIGGGFCRYSVDERWMIPHFEKMLYDNALLLALYADAWHLTAHPLFRATATGTADWMIREMQSPEGGIYSSLDADSEGEEGKFYVWTKDQVRQVLDEREFELFSFHTGLDQSPNFEGRWHLHVNHPAAEVARRFSLEATEATEILESARRKLYRERERRIRPGCDDKILTSWNGLTIRGLAVAAGRLGRPDYLAAAERALGFIQQHLWRDGRLLATCKDGRAHLNAYLDDYACLLEAVLQVLQERWSTENLNFAVRLAERLLELFDDADGGGFYFTSHDHETLIQRRKDFMDDAVPSGNGIAARALARLGHLIHEPRYSMAAERTLRAAWGAMERMPSAHNSLLFVLEDLCFPPRQVLLRGDPEGMKVWRAECRSATDTRTMVFAIPDAADDLPDILRERSATAPVTAYICEGFSCLAPVTSLPDLANYLKRESSMG